MNYNLITDCDLIKSYREGSEESFKELFKRYHKIICSIAYSYTKDSFVTDDYAQDVWILILRKLEKFEDGNFRMWVKTVTKNLCVDKFRKSRRSLKKEKVEDPFIIGLGEIKQEEYDYEGNKKIEEILKESEEELKNMNQTQLKVLLMRMKGIPYADISRKINTSIGTCQPAYQAAIIKLRNSLHRKGLIQNDSSKFSSERSMYKKKIRA